MESHLKERDKMSSERNRIKPTELVAVSGPHYFTVTRFSSWPACLPLIILQKMQDASCFSADAMVFGNYGCKVNWGWNWDYISKFLNSISSYPSLFRSFRSTPSSPGSPKQVARAEHPLFLAFCPPALGAVPGSVEACLYFATGLPFDDVYGNLPSPWNMGFGPIFFYFHQSYKQLDIKTKKQSLSW